MRSGYGAHPGTAGIGRGDSTPDGTMPPAMAVPASEQLRVLSSGAAAIIPESEFTQKIERSVATGTPLRVKLGIDPSTPDIHIGHAVPLRKLRRFQDLGHTA